MGCLNESVSVDKLVGLVVDGGSWRLFLVSHRFHFPFHLSLFPFSALHMFTLLSVASALLFLCFVLFYGVAGIWSSRVEEFGSLEFLFFFYITLKEAEMQGSTKIHSISHQALREKQGIRHTNSMNYHESMDYHRQHQLHGSIA